MNTLDTLHQFPVAELARRIRARELSPVDLTRALVARIESIEPRLRAFVTVTAEHALAQARAAEAELAAGRSRGPLHGIPYALKDIIDTAGIATTGHSRVGIDNVPARDAAVVARLGAAGAVLLGKAATYEYAHGGHSERSPWPAPRNPWNAGHIPGGSSSGSGAAVAAGMVPFALGSDTGGSIRIPASYCGIVGHKPSIGLVDLAGVFPNAASLDCCGPMARTVEDCALVLDVIADPKPGRPSFADALGAPLRGLRVGVLRHVWEEDVPAAAPLAAAMERTLAALRDLGASLEEARLRPLLQYDAVKVLVGEPEIFQVHLANLRVRAADYGREFLDKILGALVMTPEHVALARALRERMFAEAEQLFARYDVLVTVAGGPAPAIGAYQASSQWTRANVNTPFSVLGTPALALPIGFTPEGLPLACQIAGRRFDDAMVLRVAHALERLPLVETRRPPLEALPAFVPAMPVTDAPDRTEPERDARVDAALAHWNIRLAPAEYRQAAAMAPHVLATVARIERALA